jgi:hypothetical protein
MPKTMKELVFVLNNSSVKEIQKLFAGKEIGAGSFKVVYELNDDYVLKVSEDETHEIKKEVEIKTCGGDKFLTKIYAYDTVGYTWVISEKVREVASESTCRTWEVFVIRNSFCTFPPALFLSTLSEKLKARVTGFRKFNFAGPTITPDVGLEAFLSL